MLGRIRRLVPPGHVGGKSPFAFFAMLNFDGDEAILVKGIGLDIVSIGGGGDLEPLGLAIGEGFFP